MDNFFWSANIDCKKPYFNFSPPYNLRITNASLHFDTKNEGKQILQMILDGKKHPICTLSLGGVEQAPLNLFFYAKSNLYFTAKGSGKISICGNFIPDEEEDYEAEYSSTSDENEIFNENTILQEFFGDDLLDSSDDEEYQQQYSDDDFNNYNEQEDENQQPKIQVMESDEEEEYEKIKQRATKEQLKALPVDNSTQDKEVSEQKKKRKHSKEEEKQEELPKKKEKTKKAKKNINKDNDLYLLTPKNKGVLLDSDYRRSGDFFTKDLTGSHKGRIETGSLIHLYCDIYDNNYVKLVSSESSHPVSFRSNVNKVVDFIDKTIGSMRWSCLKIIKIPTLKMPPHRREFFSKYFNITVQSTDKISYIYLKVCPLQKATN